MSSRLRIAVLGLGNLGFEIAHAVGQAGHDVVAVDVDAARRRAWDERGGEPAVDALTTEGAAGLDAAFVCVRMPEEARRALGALPSLPAPARPAFVVTTLRIEDAQWLASLDRPGWRAVEAPVSGGAARARAGTLTALVAGDVRSGDVELLRGTVAAEVITLEAAGQPTVAKLLNNAVAAYHLATFAAFASIGERHGLAPGTLADILSASSGSSWIVEHLGQVVTELLAKDLDLAYEELGGLPAIDPHPRRPGAVAELAAAWESLQHRR